MGGNVTFFGQPELMVVQIDKCLERQPWWDERVEVKLMFLESLSLPSIIVTAFRRQW